MLQTFWRKDRKKLEKVDLFNIAIKIILLSVSFYNMTDLKFQFGLISIISNSTTPILVLIEDYTRVQLGSPGSKTFRVMIQRAFFLKLTCDLGN